MMYRVRKCRDGKWHVQFKRAPGLAGGIWRRTDSDGHDTQDAAEAEMYDDMMP